MNTARVCARQNVVPSEQRENLSLTDFRTHWSLIWYHLPDNKGPCYLVPSSETCIITMGGKAGCRHWMIRKELLDWLRVTTIKSNPNKHKRSKSANTPSATGQLPGPCQLLENSLQNKSPNYQLCELINQVTQCYTLEAGRKGIVHLR